jgi:hypothetical protein
MTRTNLLQTYQYAEEHGMDDLLRATRVAMGDADRPEMWEGLDADERHIANWVGYGWPDDADESGQFDASAERIHDAFTTHEAEFLEEHPEYRDLDAFEAVLDELVENGEIGRHNRDGASFRDDEFYYTSSVGEAVGKYSNVFSVDQIDWVVENSGMPRFYVCLDVVENKVLDLDE